MSDYEIEYEELDEQIEDTTPLDKQNQKTQQNGKKTNVIGRQTSPLMQVNNQRQASPKQSNSKPSPTKSNGQSVFNKKSVKDQNTSSTSIIQDEEYLQQLSSQASQYNQFNSDIHLNIDPQAQELITKNEKFKAELRALAQAADQALDKEQKRKLEKLKGDLSRNDDSRIIEKQNELNKYKVNINWYKEQIIILKRQLDSLLHLSEVTNLENEVRDLKRQYKQIYEDRDSLKKIKEGQQRALHSWKNEGEYEQQMQKAANDLRDQKGKNRELIEQVTVQEKIVRKNHEKIIQLQLKIKEYTVKIQAKKNGILKDEEQGIGNLDNIGQEDVDKLLEKQKKVQKEKEQLEKEFDNEFKECNKQKKDIQLQNLRWIKLFQQKEKELKLLILKHREIKKLVKLTKDKLVQESRIHNNNQSFSERRTTYTDIIKNEMDNITQETIETTKNQNIKVEQVEIEEKEEKIETKEKVEQKENEKKAQRQEEEEVEKQKNKNVQEEQNLNEDIEELEYMKDEDFEEEQVQQKKDKKQKEESVVQDLNKKEEVEEQKQVNYSTEMPKEEKEQKNVFSKPTMYKKKNK